MKTRVSIVEDHDPYREHLTALISGADDLECAGSHASAETAQKHIPAEKPHVVLMDLELPKASGLELIPWLKTRIPELEILVLTVHKDPERIFAALKVGASGYLVKPASPLRILEAIAEVRAGGAPMSSQIARLVVQTFQSRGKSKKALESLSPREEEVLKLLAKGLRSKEIAAELRISAGTVATHLRKVYDKLHVHSRTEAVLRFHEAGPRN